MKNKQSLRTYARRVKTIAVWLLAWHLLFLRFIEDHPAGHLAF